MDPKDIQFLKNKRIKIEDEREIRRLRLQFGGKYVEAINNSLGCALSIEDFDWKSPEPIPLDWPKDLSKSEGLVAAYIDKYEAESLLVCIGNQLGVLDGMIGYMGKSYLGLSYVNKTKPLDLLILANSLEESVIFYNHNPLGVLLVDCYMSQPSDPFTIVVRGDKMVGRLRGCFVSHSGLGGA